MRKTIIIFLFQLIAFTSIPAQSYITESGTATFHSEVPMHTFSGTSNYLTGLIDLDEEVIDFYLDLTTLKTGIQKRDRDMRETLETDKYPFVEFYGELLSDFDPDSAGVQEVLVRGTFKIHGVEREEEYSGTLEMREDGLYLTANWVLRLEDYDIVPPSLLFVKVDQEQKIEIEALLKPVEE